MNIKDDIIQYNKLEIENIKLKFQLAFMESKNNKLKKQLKKLIKSI
jgi:ribosomal protein L29